ncbi:hypothetical protein [Pantoea piersonii]|uniref:hypothetical protein n=1 Tax=Pantoea piersonii TaxID=2364647 RepID=UPI0028AD990D|nr:hypothetical protein [Pantoea piersonii]
MTQMKKKQHLQVDLEILAIKKIRHNGKEYNFTDALVNTYCYLKGWKEAFPSYNKIADVFSITRDAAKDRVRSLEAMGLVEKIERSGQSNFYIVKEIDLSNVKGRSYSENKGTRHEIKEQETEAFTETSPQEPQQPERNPALPYSDDIHTSADSGSDDSQDEQQTESPPDDYCADDWLTDFQSEPDERSEDEELHNIYEEYKLYCDLEGIDYKAYQESFIQFMDKTMIDSRFEEFKNLGQYLFNKDWDEECDREIEGGYHQS